MPKVSHISKHKPKLKPDHDHELVPTLGLAVTLYLTQLLTPGEVIRVWDSDCWSKEVFIRARALTLTLTLKKGADRGQGLCMCG